MISIKVRLTLIEDALGMSPADPAIYEKYIAKKAPKAMDISDEIKAFGEEDVLADRTTVFPRLDDGTPFLYDYQIRGMFKDSCGMLRRVKDTLSSKVTSYKKTIDGTIFVVPRRIPFVLSGEMGNIQRPLRIVNQMGERVTLASSETVPADSSIEFSIICLNDADENLVYEWLDYGLMRGLCQWRNAGWGKYVWENLGVSREELTKKRKRRKTEPSEE